MDPRRTWGPGDCAVYAEEIARVAELLLERVGLEPGMDLLDVACGSGNGSIPAARAGARVTGVDLEADMLALARERAADAMVEVDWVEADVQELPFGGGSFDRVISTFGHMFAPDHRRTADEMKRVCRGRIGVCCWTQLTGAAAPWGTEKHVRELLGATRFERHQVELTELGRREYLLATG
jgi:ubiquinone/menaquinone biosynthesis C-methylase UbiE